MTILTHATTAPKIKHRRDAYVGSGLAAVLTILLVTQLFSFEDFVPIIESLGLGGGERMAKVLAGLIVMSELLALPFLLRMRLSPLMRIVSMVCGWIVSLWWVYIALFSFAGGASVSNVGMFGSVVKVPGGMPALIAAVAIAGATAWAIAVLWPGARKLPLPVKKK